MLRIFICLSAILLVSSCVGQSGQGLRPDENIYFPHASGQMSKISLKSDSLFLIHLDATGTEESVTVYKVNREVRAGGIEIFTGTWLYSRSGHSLDRPRIKGLIMAFKPDGINRLVLIISKNLDDKVTRVPFLDSHHIKTKYGLTFYREKFFQSFENLKQISTKKDAEMLIEFAKSDESKKLAVAFEKQGLIDMYISMLSSELLNRACLTLGYNPLKAANKLNKLLHD